MGDEARGVSTTDPKLLEKFVKEALRDATKKDHAIVVKINGIFFTVCPKPKLEDGTTEDITASDVCEVIQLYYNKVDETRLVSA